MGVRSHFLAINSVHRKRIGVRLRAMTGKFTDRILTIVVTATLTSAVWIVAGGSLMELADSDGQRANTRPSDAVPALVRSGTTPAQGETTIVTLPDSGARPAAALDAEGATQPDDNETRNLLVPVLNVRPSDLTDTYNRMDEQGSSLHEALDIMAPVGTSVVAAAPGTVEKKFMSDSGGRTLYVRSADRRTIHYYAHLSEYAEGLREGQRVRRGQRLGSVGFSGNASADAPHLHFAILRTTTDAEWWEPASAVNPYPLLTRK